MYVRASRDPVGRRLRSPRARPALIGGNGYAVNVSRETPGMDYATIIDDAVRQFYSAGNNEAHSWLLQVQASPEAWQFVWQLLDPSKVPTSQDRSVLPLLSRGISDSPSYYTLLRLAAMLPNWILQEHCDRSQT